MGYNRGGGFVHFLCFARNESTLIKTLYCLFSLNLEQRMTWGLTGATHDSALRSALREREADHASFGAATRQQRHQASRTSGGHAVAEMP